MFRTHNAILFALVTLALSAEADTITVRGGDVLGGTLQSIESGAIIFESPVAGTTLLPTDQVLRLVTDTPFKCTFNDDRRVSGTFGHDAEGAFLTTEKGERVPIKLVEIEKAKRTLSLGTASGPGIDIVAGGFARSGSENAEGAYLRLEYTPDWEPIRLSSRIKLYESGRGDFPEGLRADMEFRYPQDQAWYPQVNFDIERDTLEGLDWRGGLYGGLGWDIVETPRQSLSLSAQVGASYQDIDGSEFGHRGSFHSYMWNRFYGIERAEEEWAPEARVALAYEGRFGDRIRFTDRLSLTPRLDDDALRGRYETAFEYGLTDQLGLRLDLQLDYDSKPVLRLSDKWRTTVGAGLRLRF